MLSPQEIHQLTTLLSNLNQGFLPLEIFNEIARLTRMTIVNITPIRRNENGVEIGLIKRDENDLWWPNLWHLPGTVLRPTDTMHTAFDRLMKDELEAENNVIPQFVTFLEHHSKRGAELILIHTVENVNLSATSPVTWFPINNLPVDFVNTEQRIVDEIVTKLQ